MLTRDKKNSNRRETSRHSVLIEHLVKSRSSPSPLGVESGDLGCTPSPSKMNCKCINLRSSFWQKWRWTCPPRYRLLCCSRIATVTLLRAGDDEEACCCIYRRKLCIRQKTMISTFRSFVPAPTTSAKYRTGTRFTVVMGISATPRLLQQSTASPSRSSPASSPTSSRTTSYDHSLLCLVSMQTSKFSVFHHPVSYIALKCVVYSFCLMSSLHLVNRAVSYIISCLGLFKIGHCCIYGGGSAK